MRELFCCSNESSLIPYLFKIDWMLGLEIGRESTGGLELEGRRLWAWSFSRDWFLSSISFSSSSVEKSFRFDLSAWRYDVESDSGSDLED